MKNKGFKIILTIVFVGILVFGASFARAQTSNEEAIKVLQSLIQILMQMVAQLKTQLAQKIATTTTTIIQQNCDAICKSKGYEKGSCDCSYGDYQTPPPIAIGPTLDCTCTDYEQKLKESGKEVKCGTCCCRAAAKYSCISVKEQIAGNLTSHCKYDPNGQFTSLAECEKVCKITPTCTDSDGGKNIYEKGVVTYTKFVGDGPGGSIMDTYMQKPSQSSDTCYTYPNGKSAVNENYCENGALMTDMIDCPAGYTCQDGACKPSFPNMPMRYSCNIADGSCFPDTERGTYLSLEECQKFCKITLPTCFDSDGGLNFDVKGTVTEVINGSRKSYTDTCVNNGEGIYEYSCDKSGRMRSYYALCKNGCQDGACKPTSVITPSTKCADGSTCVWCGNQCTKYVSGMQCPQIAPPTGATCTCINNACTIQYGESALLNSLNSLTASLMNLLEFLKR